MSRLDYIFVIGIIFLFAGISSCRRDIRKDKIRIGFSQCISDHEWRQTMNHSMKVQASLSPEIDLTIYEAHKDLQLQIDQIEKMITDEMDVIIVSPMESEELVPVISKAYDIGIPVILIDRKINSNKYNSFVGADNLEVGRSAGNFIATSTNTPVNVIELKIGDNASPSVERSQGFHEVVDSNPNINVLTSIDYTNRAEHENILMRLLDSLDNTSIDYFYAFNDLLAWESWSIARRKGIENQIKFIGVDGLNSDNGGINLVRNGILEASIWYPTGGAEAIKLALKIVNGEKVPKNNLLSTTIIDIWNADIMKNQLDRISEQQADIEFQTNALGVLEDQYYAQNNLLKITMVLSGIILALALYSVYSILAIRKKNKQLLLNNNRITIQRNQIKKIADKLKKSTEAKFNFFTGLSHEFKTPITLILSSVESLRDSLKANRSRNINEVELIDNNSRRLLRLINNLLDFRKVEGQKFNIRASATNIYRFTKNICSEFENEARKRGIDLTLESDNEDLYLFIDRNLMDKVYFNLLSNAFKFTPDHGKINIQIQDDPEQNKATIRIKDNGIGIPDEDLVKVFEPFFKGTNNRKNSTGIGLHLSKQFVELHMGTIRVSSYHGTEFTIGLLKGHTHFNEDQLIVEPDLVDDSISDFSHEITLDEEYLVENNQSNSERYSVLVIEDNRDLLHFLKNKLISEYEVLLSDGSDGIELAVENVPDVIICDVNLPEKSGFEICQTLKKDLRTSHIPTIILTAMSDKESYLKGLSSGADLYLTKPFSYSILLQSIKSMLYNREKLRYYYTNQIHRIGDAIPFGDREQEFLNHLNTHIKDNLDNSEYSVELLAEEMGISRVQLYRKIKSMLGLGVIDYINNIRLENSREMLKSSSLSVSEIAYSNGFSSPNYFSTAFKNKYGMSPLTYRKSS
jgi:signal transduction histidine kinase/DNA-binding response OmpR family regulator